MASSGSWWTEAVRHAGRASRQFQRVPGDYGAFLEPVQSHEPEYVEYPVYWNVIEPEEGKFDFRGFDQILRGCVRKACAPICCGLGPGKRRHGLDSRLGEVGPEALPRVLDSAASLFARFPHVEEQPGGRPEAYSAMIRHLREIDEADRTVIMVQVENEPGSLEACATSRPNPTACSTGRTGSTGLGPQEEAEHGRRFWPHRG